MFSERTVDSVETGALGSSLLTHYKEGSIMNKLKYALLTAMGLVAVTFVLDLFNSARVRGEDFKSVSVVNTATNPVPTAAQGTTMVAGNVAISNTPNVTVANVTDLLFQTAAGGVLITGPQDLANIDVSRFREIRVLVVNHPSTRGSDAAAKFQLQITEGGNVVGNLDEVVAAADFSAAQENTSICRPYTLPARNLRIKAEPLLDPMGGTGHATIDLLVFGH